MSSSSPFGSPEVSVLMSCYNTSRWLQEAIDSVLAQTFQNFELILVDDGSTDKTSDIIQSYRARDKRIVPISKRHTGLADSLNVGIGQARGEWIARLDADDLCEPARLEQQVKFVRTHPEVVLLGAGFFEIDNQGQVIKKHLYPSGHRKLIRDLERLKRFFPHSSAIFKCEMARRAGCYNPVFQKTQDWDLWLRLAERGSTACLEDALVRVRKHPQQISNSVAGVSQLTYGTVASVCHFLRVRGYPDPSIGNNETIWQELITWVDRRMKEEGFSERRQMWAEARASYFSGERMLMSALRFGIHLLRSGHAGSLVRERFLGSSLPERLAQAWITAPLT